MKGTLALIFAIAGLALAHAHAKSYTMTLIDTAMVGATELKAGDYRVELVDEKAVITIRHPATGVHFVRQRLLLRHPRTHC
jgi:hypothetical protein